ncbi:unnamed protein product [Caenorhabditis auriculariae]|uniref:Tetraspanin n=1 Tax=Caenorhabditis auriculariae TaxID=2777116 RepID=A0A8S1GNH3_9PELO|nr:unnamed protein product [Caenorhabditis auriculariae]
MQRVASRIHSWLTAQLSLFSTPKKRRLQQTEWLFGSRRLQTGCRRPQLFEATLGYRSASGACEWERCLLMGAAEPSRSRNVPQGNGKQRKPRQEISACLKWLVFMLNSFCFSERNSASRLTVIVMPSLLTSACFGFFSCRAVQGKPRKTINTAAKSNGIGTCTHGVHGAKDVGICNELIGVAILALGVYLFIKDFREVKLVDIILNPAILISVIGVSICVISLLGSLGALRDNIFLLKSFALSVFFSYILVVVATFVLFILFYTDTTEGLSAHSLLLYAIKNYHTNRNLAEIVDSLQENLQCCGVSSIAQGYRDWSMSYQFNCTTSNPQPEKCGVPFSCCRKSVISEAAGSSNPLLPAMRSLECWQNALTKRPSELEHDIYTRGCLQPLRTVFESHAVHIGAAVALLIVPVCISVCLTNILAKQVDHQRFLLEREARRHERRKKRERDHRIRDQMNSLDMLEEGVMSPAIPTARPKPPDMPPPLPPCDVPRKVSKNTSTSPTRKPAADPNQAGQRRKKANGGAPPGPALSNANSRTHQWVLQQSDLVPQKPSAPPVTK